MLTQELLAVLARQHGVASYQQLRKCGLSVKTIRGFVRRGELIEMGRHVLRHAVAGHSYQQRCHAGVLDVGHQAAVSYDAACVVWGFDGFAGRNVEVTIDHRFRVRSSLAVVHTSKDLTQIDLQTRDHLRVTSAARTIIDIAGRSDIRRVADAVDSAIRDGHTSETHLHRRLAALWYPGRPGTGRLSEVLGRRPGGGLHSVLEREFNGMLRIAGIPIASQVSITGADGTIRVDFQVVDRPLVIEVNGHRTHSSRAQTTSDARRGRLAFSTGSSVLTFTAFEIFVEPDVVQVDLFRLAAQLGFRNVARVRPAV